MTDPPDYLGPLVDPAEIRDGDPIGACVCLHRDVNQWGLESRPYYYVILKDRGIFPVPVREAASLPGWDKIGR